MKKTVIRLFFVLCFCLSCYLFLLEYGKISYNDGYKECLLEVERKNNEKQEQVNSTGNATLTFSDIVSLLKDPNETI